MQKCDKCGRKLDTGVGTISIINKGTRLCRSCKSDGADVGIYGNMKRIHTISCHTRFFDGCQECPHMTMYEGNYYCIGDGTAWQKQ